MKNKFVLNFWHALLLLIGIRAVYLLIYVIIVMLFKTSYKTDPFLISLEYISILLFIPFIFWFAKKSDTNFKESFFVPDLSTVIKMIVVVVLAQTIVLSPLSHFDIFLESLKNSKLRILGATVRPLFPLLDLRMILIVPIIEELFFRGLVLKNFLKKYSPVYAIMLSSLLFGVYHLNIDTLIFHISLGIIFGILYYKTNSLILVMLAHIIWNAFSFFKYEYIELDLASSILHFLVYLTALISFVFLLLKMKYPTTSLSKKLTNDNNDPNLLI